MTMHEVLKELYNYLEPFDMTERGELLTDMCFYAQTGEEPDGFASNAKYGWPLVKMLMDKAAIKNA